MALSEEETREATASLQQLLAASGLAWVLEQVREEVRQGVTETRSVDELVSLPPEERTGTEQFKKGKKDKTATAVRPYRPAEELQLYIHAIEAVVVGLPHAGDDAFTRLAVFGATTETLTFVDEQQEDAQTQFTRTDLQHVRASGARLAALLQELRKEL